MPCLVVHAWEGGLLAKEDMGRFAGELLMPLMKSIYSNADKYVCAYHQL